MKKQLLRLCLAAGLVASPMIASAFDFGVVDAGQIFNKYTETQKTKKVLEGEKAKLQQELESRKESVKKIDDEYVSTAKKMQELRDAKKEKEAQSLEPKLKDLRQQLAQKSGDLQKYFEESQKTLYDMEEKQMGSLSKALDEKVDAVIKQVAQKHSIKAVFEKRFFYWGDEKVVKDLTEEVLQALNAAKGSK
ncbi:MAG: OmpH family outer membrane protein [Candidatus Riflebacteria bacterium]|nr:OmpH family outer membrane protein [Candidatus Riflebacteria bacterium]